MGKKMTKKTVRAFSEAVHEIENDGLLHWALHRAELDIRAWASPEFVYNVESMRKANREMMAELVKKADDNGIEHCLE